MYEELWRRAREERWNPLAWVAHLLYAPVWVLHRAGLAESESAVFTAYAWLVRTLVLVALAMLLRSLGIGDLIGVVIGRG